MRLNCFHLNYNIYYNISVHPIVLNNLFQIYHKTNQNLILIMALMPTMSVYAEDGDAHTDDEDVGGDDVADG